MTTQKKIASNRRNAQRSTGPKTRAGKNTSSKNALRHGLLAKQITLPDEDVEEFQEFRRRLFGEQAPTGPWEEVLVERIIACSWRLPPVDDDKNARPWHAKMLTLRSGAYSALMIGSSNFTCAGMGVTPHRHAEANLLTLVDRVASGRESGRLEAIWPELAANQIEEKYDWALTSELRSVDYASRHFDEPGAREVAREILSSRQGADA